MVADQALIQLQADQLKLTVLAIILILVVLLVGYRRPLPAILAVLPTVGLSPVPTVRDFGLWCAFDMVLATIAVLVLMPPLVRTWLR